MGLIDTDAAYAVLTDYYHHSTDTQHAALREALGKVESVDAVPVRHSFLERGKDGYMRCHNCGSRASAIKAQYCHHCGAKMDGKDGDNGTD